MGSVNSGTATPEAVANRLKAAREALGLSKAEVADSLGLDRSSYPKIEAGRKILLPAHAYGVCQLYGVDMNYLYLGQLSGLPSSLSKAVTSTLKA